MRRNLPREDPLEKILRKNPLLSVPIKPHEYSAEDIVKEMEPFELSCTFHGTLKKDGAFWDIRKRVGKDKFKEKYGVKLRKDPSKGWIASVPVTTKVKKGKEREKKELEFDRYTKLTCRQETNGKNVLYICKSVTEYHDDAYDGFVWRKPKDIGAFERVKFQIETDRKKSIFGRNVDLNVENGSLSYYPREKFGCDVFKRSESGKRIRVLWCD